MYYIYLHLHMTCSYSKGHSMSVLLLLCWLYLYAICTVYSVLINSNIHSGAAEVWNQGEGVAGWPQISDFTNKFWYIFKMNFQKSFILLASMIPALTLCICTFDIFAAVFIQISYIIKCFYMTFYRLNQRTTFFSPEHEGPFQSRIKMKKIAQ